MTPRRFVGTVATKSEPASIGDEVAAAAGQHVNVQPIHFEVERTLRGDARPSLELLYPHGPGWGGEVSEVFDVGDRLLVLAEVARMP